MISHKSIYGLLLVLSAVLLSIGFTVESQAQSRQQYSMDLNWQFSRGDIDKAHKPNFDDGDWRTLNLPHDWSIEGTFKEDAPTGGSGGYLPTGIGWYRKTFSVPEEMLNKNVWIQFDGIYMNSDVWINGQHLGHRPYGYISFKYDIGPYLQEGENVIAVRVDDSQQPSSRWYSGTGIYRHVWMTVTNPLHIQHWGVYATTPIVTQEKAQLAVQTKVINGNSTPQEGTVLNVLRDQGGEVVAKAQKKFSVENDTVSEIQDSLLVQNPDLWSIASPSLYTLETIVQRGDEEVDRKETTVGIRDIEYKTNEGFFLNGKHVKMHGVNLHHDGGPVGAAVPIGVWERRLKKLKDMGVNAIRTAHNPMSPEFMDLCDRMGFLVMNEAFDEWNYGKRDYTYHLYFEDWWQRDLKAFIKRDRNHPSVVMWSAGNEIGEQMPETGVGTLEKLMGTFHYMDPTRPVTTGNDHIGDTTAPTTKRFLNALDIVGYNYADRWTNRRELVYTPDKLAHPEWKMVGTESPNIYWVRDNYSLGDSTVVQPNYNSNMIRVEELWKYVSNHDFVVGDFMWTGIDYLGEAWWPTKHASSGSLDLVGFPKDSYYLYQSQWTEEPMLHLFPHWNWEGHEGDVIPVLAYTNVETVELYVNGKYFGEKRIQFPRKGTTCGWNCYGEEPVDVTTAGLHASWDVPYEPGTIKAVGKRNGEVVVTKEITTTGDPAAIQLSVDQKTLSANHRDVAHLKVEVVDENGNVVPRADNEITFEVEGEGKLIGIGNGNPRDHTSHKANHRKAFNGLALAIIQATGKPGSITITARVDGSKNQKITIQTQKNGDTFNYWTE